MNATAAPHLAFFGFQADPFPVVPDTERFFLPGRLEALMTEILHGIRSRKGFLVLTGEVGLGKTTLSRLVLQRLEQDGIDTALVFNTFVQGPELLAAIVRDFGLESDEGGAAADLERLNRFFMARHEAGGNCALIIDDAQNLNDESLELIRLISNLETGQAKLVQILLVGQPELVERLGSPSLRQLRSRIVIHAEAQPLSLAELKQYVLFKMNASGGHGNIQVEERAFRIIHGATGGVPRRVNIFMDRCLYALFAEGSGRLTRRIAREVRDELRGPGRSGTGRRIPLAVAAGLAAAAIGLAVGAVTFRGTESVSPPPPAASGERDRGTELLAGYGLEAFADDFARALGDGWLEGFAKRLGRETGYRLVPLRRPPHGDVPALHWTAPDGGDRWLVFWRPRSWVADFRYGNAAPEVGVLQRRLAQLGFYHGEADGIVGRNTIVALMAFQRSRSLDATGVPDAATQYHLSRAAAGSPS